MRSLMIAREPADLDSQEKNKYTEVHFFNKYESLLDELLNFLKIGNKEDRDGIRHDR